MVLKLYGPSMSTCTRLVALICAEKEIPFELVTVDLSRGAHRTPEYVQFQPFDDDGFILYVSRAICRSLIKKYPNQGTPGLIPTDLKEEALFEQASSIEVSHFDAHAREFVFEVFKVRRGLQTDEVQAAEHLKNLEAKLDVYNTILDKQKLLTSSQKLTLADLQHLPYGSMLFTAGRGEVVTSRANVARWWNDIPNRPAWLAVKNGAKSTA